MLMVTDFGCNLHLLRQLKYDGIEAKVMANVLANLPSEGNYHTYICDQGHSHRIRIGIPMAESVSEEAYMQTSH